MMENCDSAMKMDKHPYLQSSFSNQGAAELYFRTCLELLTKYQWIYNFQLTHFFKERVWENIPHEWTDALLNMSLDDLNKLPTGFVKDIYPESLRQFITLCHKLSVDRTQSSHVASLEINNELIRGMNPKKRHEVSRTAAVINKICMEHRCRGIVDVGSGLGYLSLTLAHQLGHRVLGVECEEVRCHGADLRASKVQTDKLQNFKSVSIWLDADKEDSVDELTQKMQDYFCGARLGDTAQNSDKGGVSESEDCEKQDPSLTSDTPSMHLCKSSSLDKVKSHLAEDAHLCKEKGFSDMDSNVDCDLKHASHENGNYCASLSDEQSLPPLGICLIGLHSCGDLTPTMLRLYAKMPQFKAFFTFSCCYHKMAFQGDFNYHHFPMSISLQRLLARTRESHPDWMLQSFALRLAAQETSARWERQTEEEHRYHQKNVAYRGILDLVLKNENLSLQRNKRRLANKGDHKDFQSYLQSVIPNLNIKDDELHRFTCAMHECYRLHEDVLQIIEPFTCLQVALQGVLESLILVDRLMFLKEQGLEAELLPFMDDFISPRNMAIVSWKT